jgi:hypothetical protein
MGYRLKDRCSIPGKGKIFSLLYGNMSGCGIHLACYSMSTRGTFPMDEAAEA